MKNFTHAIPGQPIIDVLKAMVQEAPCQIEELNGISSLNVANAIMILSLR